MISKRLVLVAVLIPMLGLAAPSSPSDLRLEAISGTSVSISWVDNSANETETGFKIYRDDAFITAVRKETTHYIDTGLYPNTTYKYTVKATDDDINDLNPIQLKGYFPKGNDLIYPRIVTADKANWCDIVKSAPSRTTIKLEDGEYKGCSIKGKSYITIMAKHKYGVKYLGKDQSSEYFLELLDNNHHINLLGIEASPSEEKYDSGLLNAHGYDHYDNHHIYVAESWIHDCGGGFLTGPRTHDVTVDKCLIHDIKQNYYFYALGWHMTMTNCVAYHPESNGFSVRGHFPLNKYWTYHEADELGSIDVRNYDDLQTLPKDEWTHYAANNFFGEGYGRNAKRNWDRGSAVAFYIGRDNNDGDDAYLPPQNVTIENNTFYNITPSTAPNGEEFAGAITVGAEEGFESADKPKVDGIIKGTIIRNNISNVPLIKSWWKKPDPRLLTIEGNKKEDTGVLKKRFNNLIEEMKKPQYHF